jgi:hypothetical protein
MTASAEPAPALRSSRARVPDFFIVGHAKCGTTAMYEMLRRHPQIYMPDYKHGAGKEPWFFSRDNPHPQANGERSVAFTGRHPMSMDEYLSLFTAAKPDQCVGEASSSYLWSHTAAARIAEAQPAARIIAILREPASFLRSLHLQLLQNRHEAEPDFRKAVALDEDRLDGRNIPDHSYWPQALIYSERVKYVEQLRRFHAVFPAEQVKVLIYDDFRTDNEATVRGVLRFLGVDDAQPIEALKVNPTIRLRSDRLRVWVGRGDSGQRAVPRALKAALRVVLPEELRRGIRHGVLYGSPAAPDEEFMAELRRRFKGEVVALSEYLDRDLVTLWGYDGVD